MCCFTTYRFRIITYKQYFCVTAAVQNYNCKQKAEFVDTREDGQQQGTDGRPSTKSTKPPKMTGLDK